MPVLRKIILAGAIIALLSANASAQIRALPDNHDQPTKEEREQKAKHDAYEAASKRLPTTTKSDPWGTVRPTSEPAPLKKKQ